MSYKCTKCLNVFDTLPPMLIRCPNCANKIFFKVRQPISKTIKAR